MYERYYGLKEKPFSLTPDPEFLFVNKHVRGALDNVIYGIERQEGFAAIVGDVGTGKTTLCWALLGKLDKNIRTALILNPLLNEEDMLKAILQDFGVRPKYHAVREEATGTDAPCDPTWMQGLTRKELIDELNQFLLTGSEQGIFHILIVDEAQNLSFPVLEQLRILSNLETAKKKLLQIIFVGQLEFQQKLNLPQLRQLDQRITIRYSLKPLPKADMARYIEHRLSVAGSKGGVGFTSGALRAIHAYSKGYPRLINVICDRSMLAGYSERARVITTRLVHKAARGVRGSENDAKVRFSLPWRFLLPIAAVLVLAVLAAIFFWARGGVLPSLSGAVAPPAPAQSSPPVPVAVKTDEPVPASHEPAAAAAIGPTAGAAGLGNSPLTPQPSLPKPESSAPSGFTGKFLVQIHSLKVQGQADAAMTELLEKGYRVFVRVEETSKGNPWYVVYSGPYDTLEDARSQVEALRQFKNIDPIIRSY
jgi:general secretion pathway protein A